MVCASWDGKSAFIFVFCVACSQWYRLVCHHRPITRRGIGDGDPSFQGAWQGQSHTDHIRGSLLLCCFHNWGFCKCPGVFQGLYDVCEVCFCAGQMQR